jgi:hypothetical protein
MLMDVEEVWLRAWIARASVEQPFNGEDIALAADHCLEAYCKRFMVPVESADNQIGACDG